jgi:two-component system, NtrC family, response regulator GlrR
MAAPTSITILVIDDEPSLVRGVTRLLRREGYTVATAANGRYALAQLQVQPYDVILSDLSMPDVDGPTFFALLGQQAPALCQRVIFLTGAASEAGHRAFLAQCGRPWLRKPYSLAGLRRAIAQLLGNGPPAPDIPRRAPDLAGDPSPE